MFCVSFNSCGYYIFCQRLKVSSLKILLHMCLIYNCDRSIFTPEPLRALGVLFSPMVSGWAGGRAAGRSLSGLYLRNRNL